MGIVKKPKTEYHCDRCDTVVTNEHCVTWKKRSYRAVVCEPHCQRCQGVMKIIGVDSTTEVK
jgi:hypothetical protein